MTYSIHGITYNTRNDALTALVAAYVSADGSATIDEIKSALNDPETPDEMARELSLELGAGEEPADADELSDHIKTHKADIIMATDPADATGDAKDTVRQIAAYQGTLHSKGALSSQEQATRAELIEGLDEPIQSIMHDYVAAGRHAYLYVHDSGDVILWASEEESEDDDGSQAIGRWQVSEEDARVLSAIADAS